MVYCTVSDIESWRGKAFKESDLGATWDRARIRELIDAVDEAIDVASGYKDDPGHWGDRNADTVDKDIKMASIVITRHNMDRKYADTKMPGVRSFSMEGEQVTFAGNMKIIVPADGRRYINDAVEDEADPTAEFAIFTTEN